MTPSTFRRLDVAVRRRTTLASLMADLAGVHGSRRLVTEPDRGRELSYRDAAELVARWSDVIADRSEPGRPVVVATGNGYDQLLLCLAVSRAGGLPAPVNDKMRPVEIDHVVADSGASLIIRSPRELAGAAAPCEPARPGPGEVAALFYTSGTTGRPKGAALTHQGLVGQISSAVLWPSHLRHDEVVAALPVAHIMGFVTYLGLAASGLPVVCLDRFRPTTVLDLIETRRVSGFVGVPAMFRMLDEAGAADRDLSSVRVWMSGADVMPDDLARRFKGYGATMTLPVVGPVGEAAFVEGYGMVEVGGGVAVKVSPPGLSIGGDALGFRVPGYRFRVVGDDGRDVRLGGVGELWVKGPGVMAGYWQAPEATAEAVTPEGWLRTGDLVRSGPLGSIVFQGRSKQVIKSGGYSVYPLEVEATLETHDDVVEASVLGVDDPQLGQVPVAAVRLRPGATVDSAGLVAWAAEQLAEYKAPRRVVIVNELPRTATEKVQKDRLVDLFG